jgi:hypothetical protein
MIMGDMPMFSAIDAAPDTNMSALQISTIKPINIATEGISMDGFFLLQCALHSV